MFSKPKTRHIIPDYVIPSEKKRDEIRFNIRMKMFLASGIEFPSAVEAQAQKKVMAVALGQMEILITVLVNLLMALIH